MMKKTNSAVAILLSLLLVLMPMQGAVAGLLFSDQSVDHSAHLSMDMDNEVAMSCCDDHTDCSINNSCNADKCSSGHCATCVVAGILCNSKVPPITSNQKVYFSSNYPILSKSLSILYRPPRA